MMRILPICILALWLSLACNSSTSLGKTTLASNEVNSTASVMYHNGDIFTMEGDSAAYVEAVVVKVGKILYAGAKDESMKQAGEGHQMGDLHGKLMSPGFLDVHGHAFYVGFQ
jgi:predicted amidohydrolase YtcJ